MTFFAGAAQARDARTDAGPFAAVEAGYARPLGSGWQIALQADCEVGQIASPAAIKTESAASGESETVTIDCRLKRDPALSGLLRVGRAMNDSVLFSGLAGGTQPRFTGTCDVRSGVRDDTFGASDDFSVGGLTLGLGMETALTPQSGLKIEYRRTDYADHTLIDVTLDPAHVLDAHVESEAQSFCLTWVRHV